MYRVQRPYTPNYKPSLLIIRHSCVYIHRWSPLRSVPRKQSSSLTNSSFYSVASNKEIFHITPTIKAVRASANIVTRKHVSQKKAPVQMFLFHSPFFPWMWPILERLPGQPSGRHDYQKSDIKNTEGLLPHFYISQPKRNVTFVAFNLCTQLWNGCVVFGLPAGD